jgi:DNA-binding transcriptional MerR regulator
MAGRRQYERSVLDRLAIIALCQEVGFTVAEIVDFLGARAPRTRWRSLAEQKLAELDAHIVRAKATRRVLRMALDCGCGDPARCELVQSAAHRRRVRGSRRPSRTPKASSMISQRLH